MRKSTFACALSNGIVRHQLICNVPFSDVSGDVPSFRSDAAAWAQYIMEPEGRWCLRLRTVVSGKNIPVSVCPGSNVDEVLLR